jgi:hypothetical protein
MLNIPAAQGRRDPRATNGNRHAYRWDSVGIPKNNIETSKGASSDGFDLGRILLVSNYYSA